MDPKFHRIKHQEQTPNEPSATPTDRRSHARSRVPFSGAAGFVQTSSTTQNTRVGRCGGPRKCPREQRQSVAYKSQEIDQLGVSALYFDGICAIYHLYSPAAASFAFAFASIQFAYTSTSSSSAFTFDECSAPHRRQLTLCMSEKPACKGQEDYNSNIPVPKTKEIQQRRKWSENCIRQFEISLD
jgi:hypothetical protein